MAGLKIGDKVQHRSNGAAPGHIVQIKTTSDGEFRLIRVRWTTGSAPAATWETEEDLTLAE